MDDERLVAVSSQHAVRLAGELLGLLDHPQQNDYVVRTIAQREANGMPLMSAEIVIAGRDTKERHPLAVTYPLHFRKTYSLTRLRGDTAREFANQTLASKILDIPPPIGFAPQVFRGCLAPGRPYQRLSPFGVDPEEENLRVAEKIHLASAAGLWGFAESAFKQLGILHDAGLAHGDAELHNIVVCPTPLEVVLVDFEAAVKKDDVDQPTWQKRRAADTTQLLREAVFLQCVLGRQQGPLAEASWQEVGRLFRSPDRFRRAMESQHEPPA
jgi:serine/threonine protein kinase